MRVEMQGTSQMLQEKQTPTIMVVDDEEIIRDLCKRALKEFKIIQANNGQDALEIIQQQPVDLVLADVMMPVMNGLELLQAVKEKNPEQLVVIMTGYAEKDIILRALKAEADDFIQKPINLLQLRTAITKAFEKKQLRQELMQLKQLDRIKADFLGLISHKLRTPTTSISLFIQNLANGAIGPGDPGFATALNAISEEANYLAYLIEDLLYYSDIILRDETPQLSTQDLKEVLVGVLASKRDLAAYKGLSLHNALSGIWPAMTFDRVRLAFAISALLDNAIKFTPSGGQVTLSGQVTENNVEICVTDDGPGIAAEELSKVFEKFYQIDPAHTGQVRGFGLGLYYTRQFIRDHGGSIILESKPGLGTKAIIKLPRISPVNNN